MAEANPHATRPLRRLGALLLLAAVVLAFACTTPLELGERRYQEGDRLAALEIWRSIKPDNRSYHEAQERITQVEAEFEQLVVRYRQQGRYYERKGRLAESVLSYRLALKLQPDDHATLARVQELVRTLAQERASAEKELHQRMAAGDLAGARQVVEQLRVLDPFSPELASQDRQLDRAVQTQVAQWMAQGRRGFSSGNAQAAETAFRKVLDLDPDNESARGYLSYISRIQSREGIGGGTASADADGAEFDASDAEIRAEGFYQNGLAAERAGRPFDAIRLYLDALQENRAHAGAREHLTAVRSRLEPTVPQLIEAGRVAYQQEDLQAALDQWNRALLIDPRNAKAREYAKRAEQLIENLERLRDEPAPPVSARGRP
jgi:tetratricopeptide (TPR) repeat protein